MCNSFRRFPFFSLLNFIGGSPAETVVLSISRLFIRSEKRKAVCYAAKCNNIDDRCNKVFNEKRNFLSQNLKTLLTLNVMTQNVILLNIMYDTSKSVTFIQRIQVT